MKAVQQQHQELLESFKDLEAQKVQLQEDVTSLEDELRDTNRSYKTQTRRNKRKQKQIRELEKSVACLAKENKELKSIEANKRLKAQHSRQSGQQCGPVELKKEVSFKAQAALSTQHQLPNRAANQ
ncbi:hypothetical protein AAFF_G00427820 [Aldrovandia affinis]|uniref:Uncharacterized protein n=1 Tax=Aldrovandia affinis TaxID=143900 RepID=A0AAD7VYH3_9TELE|nr:hypothetical protein AAFF_G00427820 [Aldrovandia affinis]